MRLPFMQEVRFLNSDRGKARLFTLPRMPTILPLSVADPGISKRGEARSRRGRIFRSGVRFDAPSHILYVFVARVMNKIHNANIVY